MTDYILEISYDSRAVELEETIQSMLFLTASTGSTSREAAGTTTIDAYFDTAEDRDHAARTLRALESVELRATNRARVDWLELYQQSLEPMLIGTRFIVAPDASLIDADSGRLALVVPQEQAFGTGSHETTSLCVEMLESLDLAGKRGLDIGSGSGILALAMLRLGAAKAIAFDNDPDAFGALRDNRLRNRVLEASMPLFIGSVEALRGGVFDVVTMNIIPEVIIPLLPEVVMHLGTGSTLLLSGILTVRRDDVVDAARVHGLTPVTEKAKGEWWAGTFSAESRTASRR